MRVSATQKPALASALKTTGSTAVTQLVKELDAMHGHAITLQDEQGRPTPIRVNTSTRKLEAHINGKWVAVG